MDNIDQYKGSRDPGWQTPKYLFDIWDKRWGPFNLDPCTTSKNPLGIKYFFTSQENGLIQPWLIESKTRFFMNPPYGRETKKWVRKAHLETEKHRPNMMGVGLLPSRTGPTWFHDYILPYYEIIFLPGRISFVDINTGFPVRGCSFDSMLVIYR